MSTALDFSQETGMDNPLDAVLRYLYDNRDGTPLSRESLQAAIVEVTGVETAAWLDFFAYDTNPVPPLDSLI